MVDKTMYMSQSEKRTADDVYLTALFLPPNSPPRHALRMPKIKKQAMEVIKNIITLKDSVPEGVSYG